MEGRDRLTLDYEDNNDLNDWIDASNDLAVIFELQFRPSEVLFYVDREAYLETLETFSNFPGSADDVEATE